jgi:sec-independent protein translocase protein TatA
MIGTPEILIIAVVVLVLFGGSAIPKFARSLGRAQKEFKEGLAAGEREAVEEAAEKNTSAKK